MSFAFPWEYDFPPFFTIQPNATTREKQLEAWGQLVLRYCNANNLYVADVTALGESELFNNRAINRRLDHNAVLKVLDYLEGKKCVEWTDRSKKQCHIHWQSPAQWGEVIYSWAQSNGFLNSVVTLDDLIDGDDTLQESFHGINRRTLLKALEELQSSGRAAIVEHEDLDATPPTEEFEITETVDETVIAPKRKKITSNAEKLQALGMISTLSSSAEERIDRASFIHYRETIEEGDIVIVHITSQTLKAIRVERGKTLNMQMGALRHEFLIGKPYGSRITTTNGFVHALRPNPVLWSRSLKRFTQILYQHDIATIIMLLDVVPGSVICESGTGSGSLTHALAVAVGRHGHVYTHDVVEARVKAIEQDLNDHGLGERTTCILQDVYEDGFFVTNSCDGVFLDLPEPWRAIEHAKNAISRARGGRLISFSPCVEQVVKCIEEMKNHGFHLIETIEVIPTTMKVSTKKQRTFQSFLGEPPAKKERLEKSASAPEAPTIGGGDDDEVESPPTEAEELAADEGESTLKKEHAQKFDYKEYFVAKPVKQATHSGYLTSATLLPY